MDDDTRRLYIAADISGLTPRYIASEHMHPGADAWVKEERLAGLVAAAERLRDHATQDMSEQMDAWDALDAALADLAPPDDDAVEDESGEG